MVKQVASGQLELVTNGQVVTYDQEELSTEMTTTDVDDHREEIGGSGSNRSKASSSTGALNQWPRPRSRRIRRRRASANGDREGITTAVKRGSIMKSILLRLLWSSSRAFNLCLSVQLCTVIISLIISPEIHTVNCDDELQQAQQINLFSDYDQKQRQTEFYDLIQNQRDGRQLNLDNEFIGQQQQQQQQDPLGTFNEPVSSASMYTTQFDQLGQPDAGGNLSPQFGGQAQQQVKEANNNNNDLSEQEQLETAQTKAQTNSVSASATSTASKSGETSEKATNSPDTSGSTTGGGQGNNIAATSTSSLSDHLNAVNKLIQQAGQLGLSAAQQNVALSEAIINSVTNTLSNRRPASNQASSQQQQASASSPHMHATAAGPSRPGATNLVGQQQQQTIDGGINIDPNSINGFIEFPNFPNFTGALPSLGGAVKPLLLAAIKTAPIKIGSVGWKLLKLIAWKKIYKAHHPKSGEIIIEQEMKHSGGHTTSDKGSNIKEKISDHFESKFKTPKMGQSYMADDWMSMMRSTGGGGGGLHGSDMGFAGGGWPPHMDPQAASASMIYQRHLLPTGSAHSIGHHGGGGGHQQAAAVAAAAAATAAAIQSHWAHQQQQQQQMAEESSDAQQTKTNLTSNGGPSALRRKKASFGGGNWFAATPAHAYAAAAAAANAAAVMASQQQQQQQQQQRLAHLMRGYDPHGHHHQHPDMMHAEGGAGAGPSPGGGLHHALATGLMYQSLFDNAAAMAVQNAVKLPPTHHHHHIATDDYMDQSDSLSAGSFGSFTSSGPGGGGGSGSSMADTSLPLGLMQRHDLNGGGGHQLDGSVPNQFMAERAAMDNYLGPGDYLQRGPPHVQSLLHRSNSFMEGMPDFDDTPVGKAQQEFVQR